ncbi:glycosyltransferase family 2 protein [Parasulfuritortus cantonensis]|uniref:Glycosyltransferase family 2 protein n=1 Tax=Parasulfuritortus cantonensis TaxID=2528202 RepID=A0A4R1BMW6_9PROT|nr:glycosyltransferase family 2 protein [Parasulfuritortus cantonensis]TCJ18706.1 glycosyltransferase family 2 protein [Parasulfuritortus cantonensis]
MPTVPDRPRVTVVVATYGRPDALVCALRSVRAQTCPDWRLVVVGDACGDATGAALAPFLGDRRIAYANLPWRCGEQALPNSAAMALADSDFIAFLNHDDLWLPDHLAVAIRQLEATGADFFVGRSAWVWDDAEAPDVLPPFASLSPRPRSFTAMFRTGLHYIEPVSAWVVRTDLARRVGPWRRSRDLFRTPIHDWAIRAGRRGARLAEAEAVTCIKFENHWRRPERRYETPAHAQEAVLRAIEDPAGRPGLEDCLRGLLDDPGAPGRRMRLSLAEPGNQVSAWLARGLLNRASARLYFLTGLDAYGLYCILTGVEKGRRMRKTLKMRTGETDLAPPPLARLVDFLRTALRDRA